MVDQLVRPETYFGEMLTIAQVSRRLHAHPNSVRRWANQGLLKCYRFGLRGDRRFSASDVEQFLQSGYHLFRNGGDGQGYHNGNNGNGGNGK